MTPSLKRLFRLVYPVTKLTMIGSRMELPYILNALHLVGRGVEVGVRDGAYSEHLLRAWKGRCLYSVDPWLHFRSDEYKDVSNTDDRVQEELYDKTCRRLSAFGSRSQVMRTTSLEAAAELADSTLDFVYLDARHDYSSVCEDILAWWPKVRPGGILSGHDYLDGSLPEGEFGVKRAVDEFAESKGARVYVSREQAWPSRFLRS